MKKLFLPILLIILLTSCSAVYYGGITGTVKDAETGEGINDVMVAVYFDEGRRNSEYDAYDKNAHADFNPAGADGIAYTSANGSYSFSKVWWETNSPEYGKDADKADVYLLFYNENYGLTKSDSSVTLYSESTSQIKTAELTSIVDTYTYNIDLRDDSDSSSLTDGIEFHYSYTDYRGVERSGNINAVGTYSIPVVYYKGESVPQITLSNFESVNKEVDTSSKESVEQFSFKDEEETGTYILKTEDGFDGTSQSQTDSLYFTKNWFRISISGQVLKADKGIDNVAVSLDVTGLTGITPSSDSPKTVYTDSETAVGEGRRSGMFSGLGEDIVFFIDSTDESTGKQTVTIKVNDEETNPSTEIEIKTNQSEYRVSITLN